jgi:hypothetical protein
MARHSFGGDLAAWTMTAGGGNVATLVGSATVTFWTAQTGGTQHTDLRLDAAGTQAADHIDSSSGSDGLTIGTIPMFWGPDEVVSMWASANGGPRMLILANDIPAVVNSQGAALSSLSSSVAEHITANNPHATKLVDLSDITVGTPTDGQVVAYDAASGKFIVKTVAGLSGAVTLAGAQTITGAKTVGPLADVNAQRLQVYAEATGQVADLMTFYSGTDTGYGGARQRTTYFNEKGEYRGIAAAANSVAARVKGQPGQTAHVFEITDTGNNPLAWFEPDGRLRAPNLAHIITLTVAGNLSVGVGKARIYNDTGVQLSIRSVRASVGTAPTTQSILIDVNKSGTTIFTTQGNRPAIAAGSNTSGKVTNMNVTTINDGEYLTVDIDQVGSGTVGADLVVQLLCY